MLSISYNEEVNDFFLFGLTSLLIFSKTENYVVFDDVNSTSTSYALVFNLEQRFFMNPIERKKRAKMSSFNVYHHI